MFAAVFLAWHRPWDETQPIRLENIRLDIGGHSRRLLLYDPATSGKRPLVIVLHGGRTMAERAVRQSRFNALARREGLLVAYPDGVGPNPFFFHSWNAGHCCGPPMWRKVDDIGFIDKTIDHLIANRDADPARVYVAGFSAGGMLALKSGIELTDKVAAVASVSGALFGDEPPPQGPLPVMMVRGAQDNVVPGEGVGPGVRYGFADRDLISTEAAGAYWGKANGCVSYETVSNAAYRLRRWTGCTPGTEVLTYDVAGVGHAWPGEKDGAFDATAQIWAFFKAHPRGDHSFGGGPGLIPGRSAWAASAARRLGICAVVLFQARLQVERRHATDRCAERFN